MAKLNLGETQKTPGSHRPAPSYLAQLASMPTRLLMALEQSAKDFFAAAATVEGLLTESITEISKLQNETDTNRLNYSKNLLNIPK